MRYFVLFMILFSATTTFGQEIPKITTLKKGQPAPWDGALLNASAQAQIIAEKKNIELQCSLQIKYATDRELAKCDLLVGNAKLNLQYSEQKYKGLLDLKDKEIERMTKLAEKGSKDYSKWWLAGGIIIGVAVTTALYFAASAAISK